MGPRLRGASLGKSLFVQLLGGDWFKPPMGDPNLTIPPLMTGWGERLGKLRGEWAVGGQEPGNLQGGRKTENGNGHHMGPGDEEGKDPTLPHLGTLHWGEECGG